jgi:hypothetical protein
MPESPVKRIFETVSQREKQSDADARQLQKKRTTSRENSLRDLQQQSMTDSPLLAYGKAAAHVAHVRDGRNIFLPRRLDEST